MMVTSQEKGTGFGNLDYFLAAARLVMGAGRRRPIHSSRTAGKDRKRLT